MVMLGVIFILSLVRGIGAQPFAPSSLVWRRLGESRGFTGGAVSCILQDRRGIIWVGASGGLFRYDGTSFTAYRPRTAAGGLASSSVSAMAEDRLGNLWVGTDGAGLFRYRPPSGEFESIDLPHSGTDEPGTRRGIGISALASDGSDTLFAGTDSGGIFAVDTGSGTSREFGAQEPEGVSSLLADSRSRVWIGRTDGILELYDRHGTLLERRTALNSLPPGNVPKGLRVPGSGTVRSILEDSLGFVWLGLESGAVLAGDSPGETATVQRKENSPTGAALCLTEDSRGRIWIGYEGGDLGVLDPSVMEIRLEPFSDSGRVTALFRDRRGLLWAGLQQGGLATADLRSALFERFRTIRDEKNRSSSSGSPGGIRTLAAASDGTIYLATEKGFLSAFDSGTDRFSDLASPLTVPGAWTLVSTRASAPVSIPASTPASIHRSTSTSTQAPVQASTRVPLQTSRYTPDTYIRCMTGDQDGSIWMGGGAGLLRFTPGTGWKKVPLLPAIHGEGPDLQPPRQKPDPESEARSDPESEARPGLQEIPAGEPEVLVLAPGMGGTILAGTRGQGVYRIDPRTGAAKSLGKDPARGLGRTLTCLVEDRFGRVWAGSEDSGLARFDPGTGTWRPVGAGRGELGDRRIECLFVDRKGDLVVGTGGAGLAAIDVETGRISYRGQDAGMQADSVYAILEDRSGFLWISTSRGLYALDPERKSGFLYGPEDGLGGEGMRTGPLVTDRSGRVLVATGTSLVRFDPERIPRYAPVPEVIVAGISPADENQLPAFLDPESGITLGFRNQGLRFGIAVVDYLAPERNRYAMMLEGRNPAWIPMGPVSSGYIAPLAPGKYMLRVKAANANGIWNDYGDSLAIEVQAPWWAELWFRILALGITAVLIAGLVKVRTGSLRKRNQLLVNFARHVESAREEERTTAARQIHDEIGQHLMALNFHLFWLKSHPEADNKGREEKLLEMQNSVRDAMESVKTVAGSLRPQAIEVQDLSDTIRLQLSGFRRLSGMEAVLELSGDEGSDSILTASPEISRALIKILQEALGNAARHSGGRTVRVSIIKEDSWIGLTVADDGRGVEPDRLHAPDSFGIIGMRERAAALGGSLDFGRSPSGGCEVRVRIPAGPGSPADAEDTADAEDAADAPGRLRKGGRKGGWKHAPKGKGDGTDAQRTRS